MSYEFCVQLSNIALRKLLFTSHGNEHCCSLHTGQHWSKENLYEISARVGFT